MISNVAVHLLIIYHLHEKEFEIEELNVLI